MLEEVSQDRRNLNFLRRAGALSRAVFSRAFLKENRVALALTEVKRLQHTGMRIVWIAMPAQTVLPR